MHWSVPLMKISSRKSISYCFDRARQQLNALLDWSNHGLELFVRVVHQNGDTLSKTRRQSHFDWMTDAEVSEAETIVAQAFARTN